MNISKYFKNRYIILIKSNLRAKKHNPPIMIPVLSHSRAQIRRSHLAKRKYFYSSSTLITWTSSKRHISMHMRIVGRRKSGTSNITTSRRSSLPIPMMFQMMRFPSILIDPVMTNATWWQEPSSLMVPSDKVHHYKNLIQKSIVIFILIYYINPYIRYFKWISLGFFYFIDILKFFVF